MKKNQSTTDKDFSGQLKTVNVATKNGAANYGAKTIPSDRTGAALNKVVPPTPLSSDKPAPYRKEKKNG